MGSLYSFNGFGVILFAMSNFWMVRYIVCYMQETREDYKIKLTVALAELDYQKAVNIEQGLLIKELTAKK